VIYVAAIAAAICIGIVAGLIAYLWLERERRDWGDTVPIPANP